MSTDLAKATTSSTATVNATQAIPNAQWHMWNAAFNQLLTSA
jgi:hypothetical protein